MFSSPLKKSRFLPDIASFGFFIVALPVTIAIVGSLWLTATAAYENIKFARSTDQILAFISMAREDAAKDTNFGQQPNEDIVEDFMRLGQFTERPGNAWGGVIRVMAESPSSMRIEVDLPAIACRRLATYFGKEADDVALQKLAAREWNGIWRQFYNVAVANAQTPSFQATDAACGKSENTTLALTLRLR